MLSNCGARGVRVLHVSRGYHPGMHALSSFRLTEKWPPRHPDRLQLYSLPTPNGVKVSMILEEIGLPRESGPYGRTEIESHSRKPSREAITSPLPARCDLDSAEYLEESATAWQRLLRTATRPWAGRAASTDRRTGNWWRRRESKERLDMALRGPGCPYVTRSPLKNNDSVRVS